MSVPSLVLAFVVTAFLGTAMAAGGGADGDFLREFRDLFSEFLRRPSSDQEDPRTVSKRIRDTSDKAKPDKPLEGRAADRPRLSPLYECNHFDAGSRLCVNIRQLGTTLTIGARVEGVQKKSNSPPIHWYRVFAVRSRAEQEFSFLKLTKGNVPWNINIGGDDSELRISPVTEMDFSYNFFLATLDKGNPEESNMQRQGNKKRHSQLLMFSIEPISIDMGALYHGEEITISVRSHMELPPRSVKYEWGRVDPDFEVTRNLPSNMKLSRDGSSIIIKEHRNNGVDMVLTCAVYSNRNFTLARRNFFLGKIVSAKNSNLRVGHELTPIQKRSFLDDFYAPEFEARSKYRRDALPFEDTDDANPGTIEFTFDQRTIATTSKFSIVDKPQEAILNFYRTPENRFGSETEDPMALQQQFPKQQGTKPVLTLDDLIEEANGIAEDPNSFKNEPEPASYSTMRIVSEERPTYEDRESMLIADCDRDADCGPNALCFRIEGSKKFCRCKPHYRGNGLFCWLF